MGILLCRSAFIGSEMCREPGGALVQIDRQARAGGTTQCDSQPVQKTLSSCIVRAQAQCLISRVGVISPQAREAAKRREVSLRVERELREERKAQWMATVRGPGWARRGR